MKKLMMIQAFALLLCVTTLAQDKKVAVMDPVGSVPKTIMEIVREEISSVVVNALGYTVLERSLIDKVLQENKFQMSGLVDDSQISEIGKRMGANFVLVTSLTIMENGNYYISCKLIDVLTARIEKQKTGRSERGSNDLIDIVDKMVGEMFLSSTRVSDGRKYEEKTTQEPTPKYESGNKSNLQSNSVFTVFEDLGLAVINKPLGSGNWENAKTMCNDLSIDGYKDWYLPSKSELVMIFGANNRSYMNRLKSLWYWSSTEIDDNKAYNVMQNAWATDEKKRDRGPDCICVRKLNR